MTETEDQSVVAYHEAAHAVVGFMLGAVIGTVDINGSINRDSTTSWGSGNADVDCDGLRPHDVAKIAFAGPLAEIKSYGYVVAGIPFDESAILEPTIVPQLVAALSNVANSEPSNSMKVCATIVGGEKRHDFRIHLGNCADDANRIESVRSRIDDLNDVAARTLKLIEEPRIWSAVRRLADQLVSRHTLVRKELEGPLVRRLLSSLTDLAID
jgi:hypothetical protein